MKTFWTISIFLLAGVVTADDIAVTVYNSNLGVISETRSLEFKKGVNRLMFRDVPSGIDANSVRFELIDKSKEVAILEQNYAFDLVSSDQIYKRYIDKEIELVDKAGNFYSGILLTSGGGNVILEEKSGRIKIVLMANIAEVNFPSLPDGLITKPSLFWLYNSNVEGNQDAKISYQTSGMSWTAEYVGVLAEDEKTLKLSGWAAINNTSGKKYNQAKLRLIAGDIHRARPERQLMRGGRDISLMSMEADGFVEKSFFEYHMYTLPRKADLANREIKQISLFDPAQTSVEKEFIYLPDRSPTQVKVKVKFTNSKETGMGLPLPAGRVRLFQADDDGSLILLGEDRINHTPKNEKLSLKVGTAFDVIGEHRMTNRTQISSKVETNDFVTEVRNHKKVPVTVVIEKQLYGFWEIISADFEYKKKNSSTIAMLVTIPPDGEASLKYSVRITRQ